MNNNDVIVIPTPPSRQSYETANSNNKMTTFGRNIRKYIPHKSSLDIQNNQINFNTREKEKLHKSLQKLSIKQTDSKIISSLAIVAYPELNGTKILVASVPKDKLFNIPIEVDEAIIIDSQIKIPSNKFQHKVASFLLNIPISVNRLESKAKQKTNDVFNYFRDDNAGIDKEKMNIGSNSMIYTNGDICETLLMLKDLTSNWNNSFCVYSKENLMTVNKLKELKRNNNFEIMLDSCTLKETYNFSIFANSTMPNLKETIYLNFFNISPTDLEKVDIQHIKMIDIKNV
jgi:hypothetical protein